MTISCPFCEIVLKDVLTDKDDTRILDSNDVGFVIRDGFPISPGHTLIIPKLHIGSFFEITESMRSGLFSLLDEAKRVIDAEFQPDSYNIGINDGIEAGQTVPHLHIHLIPRYNGDVTDPRGGVRWVIADKADYWSKSDAITIEDKVDE